MTQGLKKIWQCVTRRAKYLADIRSIEGLLFSEANFSEYFPIQLVYFCEFVRYFICVEFGKVIQSQHNAKYPLWRAINMNEMKVIIFFLIGKKLICEYKDGFLPIGRITK